MTLNERAEKIYQGNKAKGFWDEDRNVGEMLMLVVTELSEALEAHRGRRTESNIESFNKWSKQLSFKENFEKHIKDSFNDEIADALIRILDLCGGLGIDIDWHVKNKLKYNATRGRKHGKKY